MLLLSKLSTAGATTLGLGGLSVFLIPYLLGGSSQFSKSLYNEETSNLENLNLLNLKEAQEKQIQELLTPLFEKFKKAFDHSLEKSQEMYTNLTNLFTSVQEIEDKLREIYNKNIENFKELEKLNKQLQSLLLEQLKATALSSGLESVNNLFREFEKVLSSLEGNFSQLIGALNPNQTNGSSSNTGGALQQVKKLNKH